MRMVTLLAAAAAAAAAGWMPEAAAEQKSLPVVVVVPLVPQNISRVTEFSLTVNASSNASVVVKATVLAPDVRFGQLLAEASPSLLLNLLPCPLPDSALNSAPNTTQLHLDASDCRAAGGGFSGSNATVLQRTSRLQTLLSLLRTVSPQSAAVAAGDGNSAAGAASELVSAISKELPQLQLVAPQNSPQLLLLATGDTSGGSVPKGCGSSTLLAAQPTAGAVPNCSLCDLSPANVTDFGACGEFAGACDFADSLRSATVARRLQLAELLPLLARQRWLGANQSEAAAEASRQLAERQYLRCWRYGSKQLHAWFAAGSLRMLADVPVPSILEGRLLTIGIKMTAPFSFAGSRSPDGYELNMTGLSIDMLNEVARRLKFTYRLKQPADGMWGGTYPNGTWNGMVSEVANGIIDFAVGPFTMTYERQTVIQFSAPYMEDGNALLIKKPSKSADLLSILTPFSGFSWLMVMVSLLVGAAVVFFMSWVSPFSAWNLKMAAAVKDEVSLKENVWNAVGVFMQQGQDYFPLAWSARIALATWWFVVVVIYACYMAELVGYFTLDNYSVSTSITGIEGLAEQDTIIPMVEVGTNVHTLFQKAAPGTTYSRIYAMTSRMPRIRGLSDAIKHIMKNDPPYAYISDKSSLSFEALTNCDLIVLPDTFNLATFGWPLPKGAPYNEAINQEIRRLRDTGLMARWLTKWWRADQICRSSSDLMISNSVIDLAGSAGTYLLYGCFAAAAAITLLVEFGVKRLLRRFRPVEKTDAQAEK